MWVSRVRITGGFLAGLDIELEPGLNVIVGRRGSGKTTLLELIRHALGTIHADQRDAQKKQQLVSEVLGSGEVILDVRDEFTSHHLVVDAAGAGRVNSLGSEFIILGQSEIEGVAADLLSRLHLIDMRVGHNPPVETQSRVSELTERLYEYRRTLDSLREQSLKRPVLERDKALLLSQEAVLLGGGTDALRAAREVLQTLDSSALEASQGVEKLGEVQNRTTSSLLQQAEEVATSALAVLASLPAQGGGLGELQQARAGNSVRPPGIDSSE